MLALPAAPGGLGLPRAASLGGLRGAMSIDGRGRPGGGRRASWTVSGYDVDAALDWGCVLLAAIVLAASEAGTPRAVYVPKSLLAGTNYPLGPDSVPAWTVPLYALLLPAVAFGMHSLVLR